MSRVIISRDADAVWEEASANWQPQAPGEARGLRFKRLMRTLPGMPNMQRTQYHPFHHERPHSHPEDEVLFVLAGELFHGRDRLVAGDAIYVARDTTYSLRTEETGAEFVRVGMGDLSAPPQD